MATWIIIPTTSPGPPLFPSNEHHTLNENEKPTEDLIVLVTPLLPASPPPSPPLTARRTCTKKKTSPRWLKPWWRWENPPRGRARNSQGPSSTCETSSGPPQQFLPLLPPVPPRSRAFLVEQALASTAAASVTGVPAARQRFPQTVPLARAGRSAEARGLA